MDPESHKCRLKNRKITASKRKERGQVQQEGGDVHSERRSKLRQDRHITPAEMAEETRVEEEVTDNVFTRDFELEESEGDDDEYGDDEEDVPDEEEIPHMPDEEEGDPRKKSKASSSRFPSSSSRRNRRLGPVSQQPPEEDEESAEEPEDNWLLQHGVPGGPEDPAFLRSFGGHIAYRIWRGKPERPLLWCHGRQERLTTLPVPVGVCVDLVSASGLGHLRYSMFEHLNVPLILAFIERWQPDTNSFHMPFGEMTITLHDVHMILGLPVVGKALVANPNLAASEPLYRLAAMKMGWSVEELKASWKNGGVKLSDMFDVLTGGGLSPEDWTSCYLVLLVGITLFVDKNQDRCSGHFFPFVFDLQQVSTYAWGTGTLAYLYRQLGTATRADCCQIGGCLTLLEAWIYEYFPTFRERSHLWVPPCPPFCMKWDTSRQQPRSVELVQHYRRRLDALTSNEVQFLPWGPRPQWEVPVSTYYGVIHCRDIAEPYMPDRCMRQFGLSQCIPRPPLLPHTAKRPRVTKKYLVKFGREHLSTWQRWDQHRIDFRERWSYRSDDSYGDYLSWFLRISHPRVSPELGPPLYGGIYGDAVCESLGLIAWNARSDQQNAQHAAFEDMTHMLRTWIPFDRQGDGTGDGMGGGNS